MPAGPTLTSRAARRSARIARVGVALAGLAIAGCRSQPLQRKIVVTSEPSGARVWVNDTEIGRTPAEAAFKFYGTYDVRLEREGYEPVHEGRRARAPMREWPGIDLLALLSPFRFEDAVEWHFDLEPALERRTDRRELERGLIDRARALQGRLRGEDPEPEGDAPGDTPGEADGESDTPARSDD